MSEEEWLDFLLLYFLRNQSIKEEELLLFIIKEILFSLDTIDIFSKKMEKK